MFIELDSTFRNRNSYPTSGQFEVPLDINGRKTAEEAVDPVALSAPVIFWTSNLVNVSTPGPTLTTVVDSTNNISNITTRKTFVITSTAGTLQRKSKYYMNLVAYNSTINEYKRITNYKYINIDEISDLKKARNFKIN